MHHQNLLVVRLTHKEEKAVACCRKITLQDSHVLLQIALILLHSDNIFSCFKFLVVLVLYLFEANTDFLCTVFQVALKLPKDRNDILINARLDFLFDEQSTDLKKREANTLRQLSSKVAIAPELIKELRVLIHEIK